MKTVIGPNTFITKFAYKTVETGIPGKKSPVTQRESICYIKHSKSKDSADVLVDVTVRTDSRDQFERAVGRSLAFKKALTTLFASKETRDRFGLGNVEFNQFVRDFYDQCPNSYTVM